MKKVDFVLLSVDDWECLYADGVAIDQGHSVELSDIMEKLTGTGWSVNSFKSHSLELGDDNPDLDNYGNQFPEKLEDCVEYTQIMRTTKK